MPNEPQVKNLGARRVSQVRPSTMGALVVRARQLQAHGRQVIDLGAGVPDYPAPQFLLDSGCQALLSGNNSYGDGRGLPALRQAIAQHYETTQHLRFDADTEITVTAGASAALSAALLSLVNPGDGVAVIEPYFESFLTQIKLAGGLPRFVPLAAPDWSLDERALVRALSGRTRFLILNTPHNPTGRVLSLEELETIARLCIERDIIVLSDETYEPFVYARPHVSIAALPGMQEHTITVASISKVFNVAGWRIGTAAAPKALTSCLRLVNDLALGAPVPLQAACARAMPMYGVFTGDLVDRHRPLRDRLCDALAASGLTAAPPEGTLSVLAEVTALGQSDDRAVCERLLNDAGILAAPGSAFFRKPGKRQYVRFSFARTEATIEEACARLAAFQG